MEASILKSTKKVLGLADSYTIFDQDIITFINASLSILSQLGIGPIGGFFIEDDAAEWADIGLVPEQTHLLKTFIHLKVRMLFDPPTTSYLITAMEKQIAEFEWRLSVFREEEVLAAAAALAALEVTP